MHMANDDMYTNNCYSSYSNEELMQLFNQIVAEKNRIDWAYYYICMELEERKKKLMEPKTEIPVTPQAGFAGPSQFQKRVDELVKKELKPTEK